MGAKRSWLFLVKPAASKMVKPPTFRTGKIVLESGTYRVRHPKHRLPHEVTLLRDNTFPRCAKCRDSVIFELLQAARNDRSTTGLSTRIDLYELPVMDDEKDVAV
jgi:hypothetical protein